MFSLASGGRNCYEICLGWICDACIWCINGNGPGSILDLKTGIWRGFLRNSLICTGKQLFAMVLSARYFIYQVENCQ
mgnify:CR=1 FL=1